MASESEHATVSSCVFIQEFSTQKASNTVGHRRRETTDDRTLLSPKIVITAVLVCRIMSTTCLCLSTLFSSTVVVCPANVIDFYGSKKRVKGWDKKVAKFITQKQRK